MRVRFSTLALTWFGLTGPEVVTVTSSWLSWISLRASSTVTGTAPLMRASSGSDGSRAMATMDSLRATHVPRTAAPIAAPNEAIAPGAGADRQSNVAAPSDPWRWRRRRLHTHGG